jgi:anaerobic selenocysteine-containing dehydrogenase
MGKIGRRSFIKGLLAIGAIPFFTNLTKNIFHSPSSIKRLEKSYKIVHSLCLGCNVRCGIRVYVDSESGRIWKVEGNPYHPNNTAWKPIPYDTPVKEALKHAGKICLKGRNAGIDHVYDPYRILIPLKRAGPRGSMKWRPIAWEQLIAEVVEGGDLFGEGRFVEGFKAVRDFTTPANPDMPEVGPKANQVVLFRGRGQPGRIEFLRDRWLSGVLGSPNFIAHDAVCANGVQTAHKYVTETEGKYTDQMRVDLRNAKFIIAFGDPYSSGQPAIVPAGAILSERIANGDLKLVHVSPMAGNVTVNATKWLPIKPATDAALMMGMIRWIIENKRYNSRFLENTSLTAAQKDGETVWTDATYLVVMDESHPDYRKYYVKDGKNIVVVDGAPKKFDEVDHADLFYDGVIDGIKVKTALQLLKEKAFEKTIEEWADICGLSADDVKWLAEEFTSYGKRAGILVYRAFGILPNGVYAVMSALALHMLIGNINWKGGYLGTASFGWITGIYDLSDFPGKVKLSGAKISREGFYYEKTSEYKRKVERGENPYPATKPWFPKSYGGLWSEALESINAKYPYACKILITYFGNPIFVLPAGHKYIDVLKDPDKVPLHIAIDTVISETSMLADYIIPDVTGFEGSYGLMNPYPPNLAKWTGVRVPAIEPLTERTPDGRPICAETFAIDVIKKLGLVDSLKIKKADGTFTEPMNRAEDYYLRAIVNLAKSAEPYIKPTDEDVAFVEENYPESFVNYAKTILTNDEWRKVCFIIARGGVFEPAEAGFTPEGYHKYGVKLQFKFWIEAFATLKHSITGENFWGTAQYTPIKDMGGRIVDDLDKDYKYTLISYKSGLHTQSRTIAYRWAREVIPENEVEISEEDAEKEGLKTGDLIKVVSASHPEGVIGKVRVTKRLRPGVIAIMFHYGHWAHGSADYEVEGKIVKGDSKRGSGIWVNKLMRIDDVTKAPIVDPLSGASGTGGYKVNLIKI